MLFLNKNRYFKSRLVKGLKNVVLKLVSAIFIKFLFLHQMIALQKLWKMFFFLSKKLFSFSKYSNFCISVLPFFLPVSHWRGWSKTNLKVRDTINCLNKNSITCFVGYLGREKRYGIESLSIDGVSDKGHFYRKIVHNICSES